MNHEEFKTFSRIMRGAEAGEEPEELPVDRKKLLKSKKAPRSRVKIHRNLRTTMIRTLGLRNRAGRVRCDYVTCGLGVIEDTESAGGGLDTPPGPTPGGRLELRLVKFFRFWALCCAGVPRLQPVSRARSI